MESVFRAAFIYFFLMIVIRISGNRTLTEMTVFDFILLLIMGDASQQAIASNDYSLINAVIIIITLVSIDVLLSFLKGKSSLAEKILDGLPLILVYEGKLKKKNMQRVNVDEADILESARKWRGLERLDQIKYAILEKDGEITIIAK